jgi:hypothetical protein
VVTRYDRIAGHPLAGVPQDVLTVAEAAITAYAQRQPQQGVDEHDAEDLAALVVGGLHEEGYVTWPTRVPDRESLVLACQTAAWQADEERSIVEAIVDEVVLPLLATLGGGKRE